MYLLSHARLSLFATYQAVVPCISVYLVECLFGAHIYVCYKLFIFTPYPRTGSLVNTYITIACWPTRQSLVLEWLQELMTKIKF